jgi:NusA-like KH domain protein
MNVTYDMQMLQLMKAFEQATRARVKDLLYFKEMPTFIVEEGELGKALGRNNFNLERFEAQLGKKIKIVEFNKDMTAFVRNLIFPYRTTQIYQDGSVIIIHGQDMKTNGLIIGARAQNLRAYEAIVQRYFPEVTEMKVV